MKYGRFIFLASLSISQNKFSSNFFPRQCRQKEAYFSSQYIITMRRSFLSASYFFPSEKFVHAIRQDDGNGMGLQGLKVA